MPQQKIYYAQRHYNFPKLDLLTLLFDSPHGLATETTQLHIDAANPSNHITKDTARDLTRALAASLRSDFSIGPHPTHPATGPGLPNSPDVVVCFSSLQILLPIAFYGTIAAGGMFSMASHSFTAPELARQVSQGGSKLLICSEDLKATALEAARLCGLDAGRVLVLKSDAGAWSIKPEGGRELFGRPERLDWERITDEKVLAERVVCLLYSSGTTGVPKGVMMTHLTFVSQTTNTAQVAREWTAPRVLSGEITPIPQRTLAHLPAAHIAGVSGYFIGPTYNGASIYWMKKYNWRDFLKYNKAYRITTFFTVPAIYARIAKSPDVADHFATLQGALSGAAPMDAELQRAAGAHLGGGRICVGGTWGLSETTGSVTSLPRGAFDDTGSVGVLHPNTMMRLVDDDERDVAEGEPGEALVKGPIVTRGYYGNAEATREAFTADGWFRTGDVLQLRNGLWYVTDRKKELIKYKGLQVAPAELEGLLLSHPLIEDAAVIGVPWEGTEAPRAYVVADRGKVAEEHVKEFVRSRAAAYKQLRGGVVFLNQIPRSAVGKILRKDLRELAERGERAKL
ncbi:4-coumarate-CoA ligase [Mytilinidion resinicola]|uniref:4-coumarate-CoA ligase n=1 Tax=Mytilinidion resinicola TaxID=574789 RepID=A0A6A6YS51_9PEZI|nr:4-coumarate-CoA ligase [Mytilinidion resinicola]KAF2811378.1 4-coumarate-CoA ligase [Mytilinidion resinicola]